MNSYSCARYYDSSLGRFLSEDLLGFDSGPNFFTYVSNNGIGATDPFGLQSPGQQFATAVNGLKPWTGPPPSPQPHGFFTPWHGWWGGEGWTGGSTKPLEEMSEWEIARLHRPSDDQDICYLEHDFCFAEGRVRGRCQRGTAKQLSVQFSIQSRCSSELTQCLRNVPLDRDSLGSRVVFPVQSNFYWLKSKLASILVPDGGNRHF